MYRLSRHSKQCQLVWRSQQQERHSHANAIAGKASLIREIQNDIATKKRSAKEIAEYYLARIERVEPQLGSFLAISSQEALQQAADTDKAVAAGDHIGPLAGVPLAIKVASKDQLSIHGSASPGSA